MKNECRKNEYIQREFFHLNVHVQFDENKCSFAHLFHKNSKTYIIFTVEISQEH